MVLWLFFGRTVAGKALRATAVNRLGARLVGIRPAVAGTLAFLLASLLAAVSGMLIGPINDAGYYDSGFLIGLKAFVGAIIGGLVSYPGAAVGCAVRRPARELRGVLDSPFKEVVVFALLVPVLLWRSLFTGHEEEARTRSDRADCSPRGARLPPAVLALLPALLGGFGVTLLNYIGISALVGARPGAADRRRRPDLVRPGRLRRHRRLRHRLGDHRAGTVSPWLGLVLALARDRAVALLLGAVDAAASRPFPAALHHRLGAVAVFPVRQYRRAGRHSGISGIPPISLGSWSLSSARASYYLIWAHAAGWPCCWPRNLLDSRQGRAIRALRGGAIMAESLGIDTFRDRG